MTYITEIAERERSANQSRYISLLTWVASIGLMGLAVSPVTRDNVPAKASLLIGAAALTMASQATADSLKTHDRVIQDYRDISDNARQQALYEAMKPKAVLEAPVAPVAALAPATLAPHDLPTELARKMRSSLILGAPRAGKGYAVAKGLEQVPANVDVWLIDPKNDPEESHYWSRIEPSKMIRFDVTKLNPGAVTELVFNHFEKFLAAPHSADRPKLLIIDECSPGLMVGMETKVYKEMMGRVATIASVGPSQGQFVWVISQATTVEDVGLSRANRASLRLCAVAKMTGDNATEKSWLESVKSTVGADMPSPELTGFIQMLSSRWAPATPFTLAPVPVDQHRAMAATANTGASITVEDTEPTDSLPPASKAALEHLKATGKAKSTRDLVRAAFAKNYGCQNKDGLMEVLSPLLDTGAIAVTSEGLYVAV
jgi:hypothetical protein